MSDPRTLAEQTLHQRFYWEPLQVSLESRGIPVHSAADLMAASQVAKQAREQLQSASPLQKLAANLGLADAGEDQEQYNKLAAEAENEAIRQLVSLPDVQQALSVLAST